MDCIVIENLAIGYRQRIIASGLTARISGGALTCLIGRNGIGKSTLLRTIAGLQPPLDGRALLRDDQGMLCPVSDYTIRQLARMVSVVLTEQPAVRQIRVHEMVGMGRLPYTGFFGNLNADDHRIVSEALDAVGLSGFGRRHFEALSDGERQKVMIAKALAQQTPIILLDEPTAFLDYPGRVDMMKMLHRLATDLGKTVLLSTHDMELASNHADSLLRMDERLGQITKDELKDYMRSLA